ncbi:unnamed protein product [Ilex paraguariensis]|uniref:Uncharacterized protein n=1 Tax=Ilex paraguariensis TaxID=185542 RepID=A0ABC8UU83_9AQUA
MTRQIVFESPPAGVYRRQPLLTPQQNEKPNHRIGEVAGGTAAECAAVCCCCPCSLMHLLILAVYKVPTGLCKKAWKKQKRKRVLKKKALLEQQNSTKRGPMEMHNGDETDGDDDDEGMVLDAEMWDRFNGAGFWRTPSKRDD